MRVLAQAGGSLRCALRVLRASVLALMGRVQLEELSDLRSVGVVCGVNLAQHLDRLLRLADSLGEPLVHWVFFSVRRAAETRAVDDRLMPADRSWASGIEAVRELADRFEMVTYESSGPMVMPVGGRT
jgi:hypothetical protein